MKYISKITLIIILLATYSCVPLKSGPSNNQDTMKEQSYSYLALGDSYTIGEGVEEQNRYPNQTVDLLKSSGLSFTKPVIIAKTGWTTDELSKAIEDAGIVGNTYDLVTLLIGVNNQYRGRSVENYKLEFKDLLEKAIAFADGDTNRVLVISIPDWGTTPFATSRETDKSKVAKEIDAYNAAKTQISSKLGVHYIDITEEYREIGSSPEMLISDKLHPSALVYERWAEKIKQLVQDKMGFKK
jgi:lysophospholipase L1-like esterase